MARRPRSHSPGGIFHLTARTQGQRPWFSEDIRSRIVEYLVGAVAASDAWLLAYAVMPTHLHLIIRQGHWRLGRIMQPLLQRTAILVHRTYGVEGHVFERRFADRICRTPRHARNAIVYTNLNPVRAGLCAAPVEYEWTSHRPFAAAPSGPCTITPVALGAALSLFGSPGAGLGQLHVGYNRLVEWRLWLDRQDPTAEVPDHWPDVPPATNQKNCWADEFPLLFGAPPPPPLNGSGPLRPSGPDLQEIARLTLARLAPGLALERVRSPEKTAVVVRVRRAMIEQMNAAGYRGNAIAKYLRVSGQCVSNVLGRARRRPG